MVSVKKLDVCIAIVGKSGMGALEYYPENIFLQKEEQMSLDDLTDILSELEEDERQRIINLLNKSITHSF